MANLAYTGNLALVVVFLIRVVGLSSAAVGLLIAAGGRRQPARRAARPPPDPGVRRRRALILTTLGNGLAGLLIPLTARRPGWPAT